MAVFAAVITPWLVRNYHISGNALGIAQYELVDRSGAFHGETLPRSYKPDFRTAYSMRAISTKFLTNARVVLLNNLRLVGTDFLVLFFGAGVLYGFRRRDVSRLRGLVLGVIVMAIIAMSLIGSDPERSGPEVGGGNLLVLLLPIIAIYGTAFFYLLLDRVPFRIKLTRGHGDWRFRVVERLADDLHLVAAAAGDVSLSAVHRPCRARRLGSIRTRLAGLQRSAVGRGLGRGTTSRVVARDHERFLRDP